ARAQGGGVSQAGRLVRAPRPGPGTHGARPRRSGARRARAGDAAHVRLAAGPAVGERDASAGAARRPGPRRRACLTRRGERGRGEVVHETVESKVLEGNSAGDPWVRRVPVYLPPSYTTQPERRYPVVYVLTGFTGRGRMLLNDGAWSPALDDRMDDLIVTGRC